MYTRQEIESLKQIYLKEICNYKYHYLNYINLLKKIEANEDILNEYKGIDFSSEFGFKDELIHDLRYSRQALKISEKEYKNSYDRITLIEHILNDTVKIDNKILEKN